MKSKNLPVYVAYITGIGGFLGCMFLYALSTTPSGSLTDILTKFVGSIVIVLVITMSGFGYMIYMGGRQAKLTAHEESLALSDAGYICFFSCDMLIAVLQIYQEYWHRYGCHYWGTGYESVFDWFLKEVFAPSINENLNDRKHVALENYAEKVGDSVFDRFVMRLNGENRSAAGIINSDTKTYIGYCQAVLNVLSQFDSLMMAPRMENSEYQQHYIEAKQTFATLTVTINESVDEKKSEIDSETFTALEQLGKELSVEWYNRVSSEIDKYLDKNTDMK